MSVLIGQYEFEGPAHTIADIPSVPGLYALLFQDNRGYMLVDIDQSDNLAKTIADSFKEVNENIIVVLRCEGRALRSAILAELIREFEYEDDELHNAAPSNRSETKAGVAIAM